MKRLALLLCTAALAGPPAYAQAPARFTIDFPASWTQTPDGANIEARAPESVGEAWCRANSNDVPSIASAAQAELNAEFEAPWDAQTWADVLSVGKDKFLSFEGASKIIDGHREQEVTLVFVPEVFGKPVTGRFASHVLVGRMVNAACFTRSETFEGLKPLFQATISSLKPAG